MMLGYQKKLLTIQNNIYYSDAKALVKQQYFCI